MKPKDQFTFDVALFVGATFVAAVVVFGLTYYFFFQISRNQPFFASGATVLAR